MTEQDKPELVRSVTEVLAYYRKPVSEFVLAVWWNACQPFSLADVRRALTAHATDPERGSFPPMVADVVRQLQGSAEDRAVLAWGKVLDAAQRVGAYQDIVFDDPAIHAAVEDCGGWPHLCRTAAADLGYVQHRFVQAHRAYTRRGVFEYPRRLTGDRSPDSDYTARGIPPPQPVVWGDARRAARVYALEFHDDEKE